MYSRYCNMSLFLTCVQDVSLVHSMIPLGHGPIKFKNVVNCFIKLPIILVLNILDATVIWTFQLLCQAPAQWSSTPLPRWFPAALKGLPAFIPSFPPSKLKVRMYLCVLLSGRQGNRLTHLLGRRVPPTLQGAGVRPLWDHRLRSHLLPAQQRSSGNVLGAQFEPDVK